MRCYVHSNKPRHGPSRVDRRDHSVLAQCMADVDEGPPVKLDASERARRASKVAHKATSEGKRRRIDPCTSEVSYDDDELEFMLAMQQYKEQRQRPFPTWKETLEVLRQLGYHKPDECQGLTYQEDEAEDDN